MSSFEKNLGWLFIFEGKSLAVLLYGLLELTQLPQGKDLKEQLSIDSTGSFGLRLSRRGRRPSALPQRAA